MKTSKTIASLFEERPFRWGLRGDPFLWQEMRAHFDEIPLPASTRELAELIEAAFALLTGHPLSESEPFFIERFSHGGMSSGMVSPEFWRDKAIPMLQERFDDLPK